MSVSVAEPSNACMSESPTRDVASAERANGDSLHADVVQSVNETNKK